MYSLMLYYVVINGKTLTATDRSSVQNVFCNFLLNNSQFYAKKNKIIIINTFFSSSSLPGLLKCLFHPHLSGQAPSLPFAVEVYFQNAILLYLEVSFVVFQQLLSTYFFLQTSCFLILFYQMQTVALYCF